MKIPILDSLIGKHVTCIKTDGSTVGGVLAGVSHLDRWDVINVTGIPPFRSTDVERIYTETEEGTALVWPEDVEDDSAALAASRAAGKAEYDMVLYLQTVGLLDRVVKVILRDGREEVGRLEAVTPHVGPLLPTLHVRPLDEDDDKPKPIRVVQLTAVRSIGIHVLTHEETDVLVVEEGQAGESAPPTVEQQREKAEEVREVPQHSSADTDKAFGIQASKEREGDAPDGEEHGQEGGVPENESLPSED